MSEMTWRYSVMLRVVGQRLFLFTQRDIQVQNYLYMKSIYGISKYEVRNLQICVYDVVTSSVYKTKSINWIILFLQNEYVIY